ncbi:MAG: SDR family NAD(P)-dependent oxidoreductase [Chloroflexi bacterium]|nr:SDR family NAD(P)-dependent oxidoreductase [Chloroflexota bacterium]
MPEAIIWGASGGIGGALVRLLKQHEWTVYGVARDEDRIPETADLRCSFDAGDTFSIHDATMRIAQESEGVDLMVYAAGGMFTSTYEDISDEDWRAVMDANLNGAQRTAQASLPLMKQGGHLMFVGAYVDKITLPRFGAYTVAKAGLEPLVTILQKENRKLKFTLVRPGAVDTPFWENVPVKLPKGAATPESVAEAMMARFEVGDTGPLDL